MNSDLLPSLRNDWSIETREQKQGRWQLQAADHEQNEYLESRPHADVKLHTQNFKDVKPG